MKPLMLPLLLMAFLVLILAVMTACDTDDVKKATVAGWATEIRTIDHDGHRWIVANTGHKDGGVAIQHHPDCPCVKAKGGN